MPDPIIPASQTQATSTTNTAPPVVVAAPPSAAQVVGPSSSTELPTINFDQFESARDTFQTPQPPVVKVDPAVSTSTATPAPGPVVTLPAPTTTPTPTTPTTTVAPIVPTVATPPKTGVDDKGVPIPVEIDLTQSAFNPQGTTTPPITPTPSTLPDVEEGRDMKGFSEDERKAFRKMSNDAFNFLAPQYREAKTLKPALDTLKQENETLKTKVQQAGAVDPLVAANPNGYIFTPDFAQLTQGEQNMQYEAQYWQKQLAELKLGKKPRLLQHNGQQYLAGPELEADGNTEALIMNNLTRANMSAQQYQQAQNQLRMSWQQQVQQDLHTIKRTEDAYFPWFADGKQHSFKPVIDGFVAQMPPTQRSNPLARALGKAYAVIQHLQTRLQSAPASIVAPPTVTNQGPINTPAIATAPTSGLGDDLMAAFEKAKQG